MPRRRVPAAEHRKGCACGVEFEWARRAPSRVAPAAGCARNRRLRRGLLRARRRPVRHVPFGRGSRPLHADDRERVSRFRQHRRGNVAFRLSLFADSVPACAAALARALGPDADLRSSGRDGARRAGRLRHRAPPHDRTRRGGHCLHRTALSAAARRDVHRFSRNGIFTRDDRVATVGARRTAFRCGCDFVAGRARNEGRPGAGDGIPRCGGVRLLRPHARNARSALRSCRDRRVGVDDVGVFLRRTSARRRAGTLGSRDIFTRGSAIGRVRSRWNSAAA